MRVAPAWTTPGEVPPPAEATLLRQLFGFLHDEAVPYCVVGDVRGLPDRIDGDVDLVVPSEVLPRVPALLRQFCARHDARLVQVLQHEQTAFYFALARLDDAGRPHFLHPDFCSDFYRKGTLFLRAEALLEGRVMDKPKGFYVAAPAVAFMYYLLKRIDKGLLEDRHGAYLSETWAQDPKGAFAQVKRFWPSDDAELLALTAASGDWAPVRDALPTLRYALHQGLPGSLTARFGEGSRRVRRIAQPTGLCVAFLGPDGSGKSSVIDGVLPLLAPAFRRTSRMHFRPALGLRQTDAPVTAPHARPPRSAAASTLKLLYYALDYLLGYALKTRTRLIRSTLVAFDRYYDDLLIDPARYRYGGPRWLAGALRRCVPRPDLVVLLDAPAEVLHTRKQEVPLEETARQRVAYRRHVDALPEGRLVGAAQPLEAVVNETADVVLDHLARRTALRLGLSPDESAAGDRA